MIHSTAIVSPKAELGDNVTVGPYSVIYDQVTIGANTTIGDHSIVRSNVKIGERNHIGDHVVIGGIPQDLNFKGAETWVTMGDENIIREYCSVHRSTNPDRPTTLGSKCFLMCNSHVAHDCILGDEVILTAYVGLSGHIEIGDKAVIGGHVGIHQFTRVGTLAMIAGFSAVRKDVLPFSLVGGEPVRHYRLNTVGLRRANITGQRYRKLETAFDELRAGKSLDGVDSTPEIDILREWISAPSKRGIYGFSNADL